MKLKPYKKKRAKTIITKCNFDTKYLVLNIILYTYCYYVYI